MAFHPARRVLVRLGLASAASAALGAVARGQAAVSERRNARGTRAPTETVRAFLREFFDAHDPAAAPRYLVPGFTVYGGSRGTRRGRDAYVTALSGMFRSLPDVRATVQDAVAQGDRAVVRVTIEGTHTGAPLFGVAPTGRPLRWTGNNLYRLEGDMIAEEWAAEDWLAVVQQLGLVELPRG